MELIKVVLVEDIQEINLGFKFLIDSSQGFSCVSFSSAEDVLAAKFDPVPDVFLMDIGLPGMNGIDCAALLKTKYPAVQIMMCTVYEDDENIFEAIKAGASAYIVKRTPPLQLLEAIKELCAGGSPMSSSIARKVLNYINKSVQPPENSYNLSDRESEVLNLISQGYRNKDVADKLFISISTVKTHINNIYEKLHVNSRVAAINKMKGKK